MKESKMKLQKSTISFILGASVIGAYLVPSKDRTPSSETCYFDSRNLKPEDKPNFSCTLVPEGKTLKYVMQVLVYGDTPEDLAAGVDKSLQNLSGQKSYPETMNIIGAKFDHWGYRISNFVNATQPVAEMPSAPIVAPETKTAPVKSKSK